MKDLTHYFASPPKPADPRKNSLGAVAPDQNNAENVDATPVKKRSRVKIRISVNGTKKNRRCDIVENKDDVVDKTPSPFTTSTARTATAKVVDEVVEMEEDTLNAFKVLMTRAKPPVYNVLPTPSPAEVKKAKEQKVRLKETKRKLVALADRKGYTKRKITEIEEAEIIEKRLEKRAKLFRREECQPRLQEKSENCQNGKDTTDAARENDGTSHNNNNGSSSGKAGRKKKKHTHTHLTHTSPPPVKELTPKVKVKWTMRVKLQSQSNEERTVPDNSQSSDDNYIFTPKSKTKLQRTSKFKSNHKSESIEREKPEKKEKDVVDPVPAPAPEATQHSVLSNTLESKNLRRKKHRVNEKKSRLNAAKSQTTGDPNPNIRSNLLEPEGECSQLNHSENSDCSIIVLDKNVVEKKLAPLFVRKSKPNPEVLEARRSFLHSGIPKNVRKIISDLKSAPSEAANSSMPFPAISHISQTQSDPEDINVSETVHYAKKERGTFSATIDPNCFKSLRNLEAKVRVGIDKTPKFVRVEKASLKDVLLEIEGRCPGSRSIWESVCGIRDSSNKKSPNKRGKKSRSQRNSKENNEIPNPTWAYKYKPTSSDTAVGNEAAIIKLRGWLSGWRKPSARDDCDSSDEFYSSDCSSSISFENNQVAVLLGPHGSGKSASVYAIAEELGYRVLEMNASSRRTGKIILAMYQEATKSHRVKRDQAPLSLVKKQLSEKKVPENSLILIEDVDLIFDEDDGFVSGTFQLAADTRRPIVLTCKESMPYLYKMAPQLQLIHFKPAAGDRVSSLLEIIALAESGYRLPHSFLNILLRNGDLRQSLLQLQYILLSGPPSISQLTMTGCTSLWPDMHRLLYKPAIKMSKKYKKESTDIRLIAVQDEKLVNTLAWKLDSIALVSSLSDVENPVPPPWKSKLHPSLSFSEDFSPYSKSAELGTEIADWLRFATLGSNHPESTASADSEVQLATKRKVKLGIDLALAQAVPSTLEHTVKATDYLPVIRTICRTEQERAMANTKRGNRFHNYLHGLKLVSASSNILAAASSILWDKPAS